MTRIRLSVLAPVVMALAVTTVSAGGWAVVTVEDLPEHIEAGKAIPLTFMVRQHGITPLNGLRPQLEARSGTLKVTADARPGGKTGQYAADLTLPDAGEWSITIHSGFLSSKLTLLPVTVVSPGSRTVATTAIRDRGQRLFVAKGCVTCHAQDRTMSEPALNVGPAIVAQKYRDEFLARVLADPSGALPAGRAPVGQMPNLNLRPQEIAALVSFINHQPKEVTR